MFVRKQMCEVVSVFVKQIHKNSRNNLNLSDKRLDTHVEKLMMDHSRKKTFIVCASNEIADQKLHYHFLSHRIVIIFSDKDPSNNILVLP